MRRQNRSLDFEASNLETLHVKKNSRSGHLSTVTAISNEIFGLLTDDHNLQRVKEKLPYLDNTFERFIEADRDYVGEILDENAAPLMRVNAILKTKREMFVCSVSRSSIG